MTGSLRSTLELFRDTLPASLIDSQGYARVAAVAELLPDELTTFWGFECRLGEAEAAADILVETRSRSRGQLLLAGRSASQLDELCRQWPVWENLRYFADLWTRPEGPFNRGIRNVWLEFDTAAVSSSAHAAEAARQPSVFFGPAADRPIKDRGLHEILDALAAGGHSYRDMGKLEPIVKALPEDATVFQIGLMLSRDSADLRLCIKGLSAEQIPGRLSRMGWPGDVHALAECLRPIASMAQMLAVNVNLTPDGLSEKIGIECYMDWLNDDAHQWLPLLEHAESLSLCLPQKRQGLLDFPGITDTSASGRWRDGMVYLNLFRKIHHLKFSISEGRVTEAKAYLAVSRPAVPFRDIVNTQAAQDAWLTD